MKIYCSGIGGIGLSAYAALQKAHGHEVLGSDRTESEILKKLREQGISVALRQDGTFLPDDTDLVVYSEAIPRHAPERLRAEELKIRSIPYFKALGELSRDYYVIAVCGTHGKSSTVAMAARVLIEEGKDPTLVVGTKLKELHGANWRKGESSIFLLEACEYRGSFLHLSPDIVLMTNVDGDHFDAFASVEDYQETFVEFLKLLPRVGTVITHMDDVDCARVAKRGARTVTNADEYLLPRLNVPGKHMQQNAQLVLGLAEVLGIDQDRALKALQGYRGCWRRMEVRGTTSEGVTVIDDYAHHPKEIAATIVAVREAYPGRRLVVAFQPHMHDRTLKLYDVFVSCFGGVDELVLTDVYDARSDVETQKVDMLQFAQEVGKGSDIHALYGSDLGQAEAVLRSTVLQPNDVLLVMGAGDITRLADSLVH